MKKSILLFAALLVCVGMVLSLDAQSSQRGNQDNSQQISLNKVDSESAPAPQSFFNPVTGWYDAEEGTIQLTFLQNLGEVTITFDGATYHAQGTAGSVEYIDAGNLSAGVYALVIHSSRGTYMGYLFIN